MHDDARPRAGWGTWRKCGRRHAKVKPGRTGFSAFLAVGVLQFALRGGLDARGHGILWSHYSRHVRGRVGLHVRIRVRLVACGTRGRAMGCPDRRHGAAPVRVDRARHCTGRVRRAKALHRGGRPVVAGRPVGFAHVSSVLGSDSGSRTVAMVHPDGCHGAGGDGVCQRRRPSPTPRASVGSIPPT